MLKIIRIVVVLLAVMGAGGCTRHGGSGSVPGQNVSGASGAGANGATSGETANSPGGGPAGNGSGAG